MFVRRVNSSNGKTYVQVIEKVDGKYSVLKSFGGSSNAQEVESLYLKAQNWIKEQFGLLEFDFAEEEKLIAEVFDWISNYRLVGPELVLGKIFDQIGFNQVQDEHFRYLVIHRLIFPRSKLKTTEYLLRYHNIEWSEDKLYRYMDKLYNTQKELVQQISFEHTLRVLNNEVAIVFYDVSTLYFEIEREDDLRITGFSKDGKAQHPQIVLGLLVSKNGYPLAYDIFPGNKFEGHTMLPVLEGFKQKYNISKLTVVADAGLLSTKNINMLKQGNYDFILGARIKNESNIMAQQILKLNLKNGQSAVIAKGNDKLIITYSDKRAKKDAYNREKGLRTLQKKIKSGKITKDHINQRGYNKFLQLDGKVSAKINFQKVEEDQKWDGLKGYITNSTLDTMILVENYQHLWQIEKAFKIAKSDLKIRPIYHRLPRRIEAHICIAFAAYKVYKELERQLKEEFDTDLTATKVIESIVSINEISAIAPSSKKKISKIILSTDRQRQIAKMFGF